MVDVLDLDVGIDGVDQLAEVCRRRRWRIGDRRERRLQRGQPFARGLRARELLAVERERAVVVVAPARGSWRSGLRSIARSARCWLSARGRRRFAGDAFDRGDGVGADALVRLRMQRAQAQVAGSIGRPAVARCAGAGIDIISVPPAITRSSMPDMTGPPPGSPR